MELVFINEEDGNTFNVDLPRGDTKHRIPREGETIDFEDGSKKYTGIVSHVNYKYKVSLGVMQSTQVTVEVLI